MARTGGKRACDKCHRVIRACKLLPHFTGELRCKNCINKYGNNKFYTPQIKGFKQKKKFQRFTLDWEEQKVRYKQLIKQGLTEDQVKQRIKETNKYQYGLQRDRMKEKPEQTKDKMKSFLKGLGLRK